MPLTSSIASIPTVIPTATEPTKPTKNAILALNAGFIPELSRSHTYVIEREGDITEIDFEYKSMTNTFLACGLTWENKHYVFGGFAINMLVASQISQGASLLYLIFYDP